MTELEKWETHDGCYGCGYADLEEVDYPCTDCIGTTTKYSPERPFRKDFFNTEGQKHENDIVNHPSHYNYGRIECIDAMESAFGASELAVYCKIAAFKYIWRMEHKNGVEDIKKAIWYLNKYIELTEKEGETID